MSLFFKRPQLQGNVAECQALTSEMKDALDVLGPDFGDATAEAGYGPEGQQQVRDCIQECEQLKQLISDLNIKNDETRDRTHEIMGLANAEEEAEAGTTEMASAERPESLDVFLSLMKHQRAFQRLVYSLKPPIPEEIIASLMRGVSVELPVIPATPDVPENDSRDRLAEVQEQLDFTQGERDAALTRANRFANLAESLKAQMTAMQAEHHKLQDESEVERERMRREMKRHEVSSKNYMTRYHAADNELQDEKAVNENLREDLSRSTADNQKLREELESREAALGDLEAANRILQAQLQASSAQRHRAVEELSEVEANLTRAERQLARTEASRDRAKVQGLDLQRALQEAGEEQEKVSAELDKDRQQLRKVEVDLASAEAGRALVKEDYRQLKLKLHETDRKGERLSAQLDRERQQLRKVEADLASAEASRALVKEEHRQLKLKLHETARKGERVSVELDKERQQLRKVEADLASAEASRALVKQDCRQLKLKLRETDKELERVSIELGKERQKLHKVEADLAGAEADRAFVKENCKQLKLELREVEADHANAENRLDMIKVSRGLINRQCAQLRSTLRETDNERERLSAELDKERQQLRKVEADHADAEERLARTEGHGVLIKEDCENLRIELHEISTERERVSAELERERQQLHRVEADHADTEERLAETEARRALIERDCEDLRRQLHEINMERAARSQALSDLLRCLSAQGPGPAWGSVAERLLRNGNISSGRKPTCRTWTLASWSGEKALEIRPSDGNFNAIALDCIGMQALDDRLLSWLCALQAALATEGEFYIALVQLLLECLARLVREDVHLVHRIAMFQIVVLVESKWPEDSTGLVAQFNAFLSEADPKAYAVTRLWSADDLDGAVESLEGSRPGGNTPSSEGYIRYPGDIVLVGFNKSPDGVLVFEIDRLSWVGRSYFAWTPDLMRLPWGQELPLDRIDRTLWALQNVIGS